MPPNCHGQIGTTAECNTEPLMALGFVPPFSVNVACHGCFVCRLHFYQEGPLQRHQQSLRAWKCHFLDDVENHFNPADAQVVRMWVQTLTDPKSAVK